MLAEVHRQALRAMLISALMRRYGDDSLTHRQDVDGMRTLRLLAARPSGYITPYCHQCPAVTTLKLRFVPFTASRPIG